MNNIKSLYVIKDFILQYLPLKKLLLLFKISRKYRQLFQLYPSIYELFCNIQNDFEPYNEHIENEMLSYIVHFSRLQKHLSDKLLMEYYFRFLLSQKIILVEYDNIYFEPLLNYLNKNKYFGTIIIKLGEPKLDLTIRPNIKITGKNIFLEIYFNMKWIDREKKDNMEYIKRFLEEKIIGEETRQIVKKIKFGEYINLNEEKYEDFFFEELSFFQNALFNIQSNYFDDNAYWKDLDRFYKLKFIVEEKLDEYAKEEDNKNKNEKKISINNNNTNNNISNEVSNKNNIIINENIIKNNNINSISKYYKEKKLNKLKNIEEEKNKEENNKINNLNNDINKTNNLIASDFSKNDFKEKNNKYILTDKYLSKKIIDSNNEYYNNKDLNNNNIKIKNDNIMNSVNKKEEDKIIKIAFNENKISTNQNKINSEENKINIINENKLDIQDDETLLKIKRLNKNILSIRELNNFILDFRKNKISITEPFFKEYEKKSDEIENKIPSKLTLINFTYEKNKDYFSELNNKIDCLIIVQRIYRNTPYPFFISPKLNSLIALKLERINILEDNLVSIINNNPFLEIFEIHKNYTGYVFGYNLALALSQLQNLKSLITEFFWYKEYIPNFKTNSIINRQENEFFKFLVSKSLKYLSLSNETNINIKTLNQNLPNLISLTMEYSNIIEENNNEINIMNTKTFNNDNLQNNKKVINRRRSAKKLSTPLILVNYLKDFNYSKKDQIFHKLRDLSIVKVDNCDELFKKMAFFNKIENLYLDYYDKKFFETFVNYGHHLNNLDMLFISPDFGERIKPSDSEKLVKKIHFFKKLTFFEIGFYTINENLINLLFNELTQLPLLQQLEIRVDMSSEENKELLQSIINGLYTKKRNSKYLTITYTFNDKRFKK